MLTSFSRTTGDEWRCATRLLMANVIPSSVLVGPDKDPSNAPAEMLRLYLILRVEVGSTVDSHARHCGWVRLPVSGGKYALSLDAGSGRSMGPAGSLFSMDKLNGCCREGWCGIKAAMAILATTSIPNRSDLPLCHESSEYFAALNKPLSTCTCTHVSHTWLSHFSVAMLPPSTKSETLRSPPIWPRTANVV